MSMDSIYNSQFNNLEIVNSRMQAQQQPSHLQAQLLFRQRQLVSQQQQQQQLLSRSVAVIGGSSSSALPPTPTLSSQGSPAGAFSQVVQVVPPPIKSILTPTTNNNVLPTTQPQPQQQRLPSMGQAVLRLLQFRDLLSPPGHQAQDLSFWNGFVDDFFTSSATMKIGLLDNVQNEQIEFDITQSLIARFFHTHYQCELESVQLTTDQTMEYFLPTGMMLECPRSSLIHRYNNGTLVILSGELSVLFNLDPNDGVLKIHQWKFICNHHGEFIARSKLVVADTNAASKKKSKLTPKTPAFHTPASLVNSWGVPERLFALLRITDASIRFSEVAFFSLVTGLTPQDALTAMSFAINQQMSYSYPEEQRPQQQQPQPMPQQQQQQQQHQMQLQQQQQQQQQLHLQQRQQQHLQLQQQQQHQIQQQQQQLQQQQQMLQQQMLQQQQQIKQETAPEDILSSSPLLTTDILSQLPFTIPVPASDNNNMNTSPFLQQNNPPPAVVSTPTPNYNNPQLMQQQAAMQRYYQQQQYQQNLRIQQQQHALQLQQRQAVQRLQQPYTTSNTTSPVPMKVENNNTLQSPSQQLNIENVNMTDNKAATPRNPKRKMSIQKDTLAKKATGKKGKKQQ